MCKTCTAGKGSTLDFFVVSRGLEPCVSNLRAWLEAPSSPRSPVELWLRGVTLAIPVHVKVSWKPFPTCRA
eukprot:8884326-Pyramimonas_sp.AAC.1